MTVKWAEIAADLHARFPEVAENLLKMDELDNRLRDAGIPVPPLSPILQEAVRIAKESK